MDTSYAAWKLRTPAPYSIRCRHQGAGGQAAAAAVGRLPRPAPGPQGGLRVRGDAPDERGDGAYDHATPPGRARARAPLLAQAPGAVRARAQEGARLLPQPLRRDALPPQARRARSRSADPGFSAGSGTCAARPPWCAARYPRPARPAASRRLLAQRLLALVHDDAAQRHAAVLHLDHDVDGAGARIGPERGARARPAARGRRAAGAIPGSPGTAALRASATTWSTQVATGTRVGVEREVVERRIAPGHVEVLAHARGAGVVVELDLVAREVLVVGLEALHQALHAQLHRRADADAGHVRHRPSSMVAPQPRISTLPFTASS